MVGIADVIGTEIASPEYERFLALNVQVPKAAGSRQYERVTICCSPRDLAADLSLLLPSHIVRHLEDVGRYYPLKPKRFQHEASSPNPKRDPYVVVCSCGQSDCQHVEYALSHFQRVMAFSQNAAQIAQNLKANAEFAVQAEQQRTALAQQLERLRIERDQLAGNLELAESDVLVVGQLRERLRQNEDDIALLGLQLDDKENEITRYKRDVETARANLQSMAEAWTSSGKRNADGNVISATDELLSVVHTHFMPAPANVAPATKYQVNVSADHHRVTNTHAILMQLAEIEFVRELGISYRRQIKSGKVQIKPEIDTLEVLVPHNGEADIIRVLTTAASKPQQMLAAHVIAVRFDLDVKF